MQRNLLLMLPRNHVVTFFFFFKRKSSTRQTFKDVISNVTYTLPDVWHLAWEGALGGGRPSWWVRWFLYTSWLVKVKHEAILKGLWAILAGKSFMSFPRHWVPQYLRPSVPSSAPLSSVSSGRHPDTIFAKTSLPLLVTQSSRIWKKNITPKNKQTKNCTVIKC